MGIIQGSSSNGCLSLSNIDHVPLSLKSFPQKTTLSNGLTIIKLENGDMGLFFSKALTNYSCKEIAYKWAKTTFQHSCNVLKVQSQKIPLVCGSHLNFKAIVEFGDLSLADILHEKQLSQYMGSSLDRSQLTFNESKGDTSVRNLQLVKLLIEVAEQIFNFNGEWVTFHTSNLTYFKALNRFKYLYLPELESFHDREVFFDPQRIALSKQQESTTVFSLGMILMSLLLRQDCSDCYNYRNFTFCWSVFEEKKDRVEENVNRTYLNESSFGQTVFSIDEEIAGLILASFSPFEKRPNFSEFKQKYFRLLRKMSANGEYQTSLSTKREETFRISNLRKSKNVKKTAPRKSNEGQDQNANYQNVKVQVKSFSSSDKLKEKKNRMVRMNTQIDDHLKQKRNSIKNGCYGKENI